MKLCYFCGGIIENNARRLCLNPRYLDRGENKYLYSHFQCYRNSFIDDLSKANKRIHELETELSTLKERTKVVVKKLTDVSTELLKYKSKGGNT